MKEGVCVGGVCVCGGGGGGGRGDYGVLIVADAWIKQPLR